MPEWVYQNWWKISSHSHEEIRNWRGLCRKTLGGSPSQTPGQMDLTQWKRTYGCLFPACQRTSCSSQSGSGMATWWISHVGSSIWRWTRFGWRNNEMECSGGSQIVERNRCGRGFWEVLTGKTLSSWALGLPHGLSRPNALQTPRLVLWASWSEANCSVWFALKPNKWPSTKLLPFVLALNAKMRPKLPLWKSTRTKLVRWQNAPELTKTQQKSEIVEVQELADSMLRPLELQLFVVQNQTPLRLRKERMRLSPWVELCGMKFINVVEITNIFWKLFGQLTPRLLKPWKMAKSPNLWWLGQQFAQTKKWACGLSLHAAAKRLKVRLIVLEGGYDQPYVVRECFGQSKPGERPVVLVLRNQHYKLILPKPGAAFPKQWLETEAGELAPGLSLELRGAGKVGFLAPLLAPSVAGNKQRLGRGHSMVVGFLPGRNLILAQTNQKRQVPTMPVGSRQGQLRIQALAQNGLGHTDLRWKAVPQA